MRTVISLVVGVMMVASAERAMAQGENESMHPYWDEAEYIPYYEEYGLEEEAMYIESTCIRVEVPPGQEDEYEEENSSVPCNETPEGCHEVPEDEPDDWDYIRLWTPSGDGLQIEELKIWHNDQVILEETGMDYWLDKYYNRQLFLDWRIAQDKHDRVANIVGEDYLNSILELASQDLGFSGARKYNGDDNSWCSDFAVYAIEQATKLSNKCPYNLPTPLETGDIGANEIYDWFDSCIGGSRVIDNIISHPSQMKPGYYLSVDGRDHSVIFVGWVNLIPGDFYVIDGNGNGENHVKLYNRGSWSDALEPSDFAGETY